MVSKSTKSIASRVPVDLYFQLLKEATELNLNMKDFILKVLQERHEKNNQIIVPKASSPKKEKPIPPTKSEKTKPPKKKETGTGSFEFPD